MKKENSIAIEERIEQMDKFELESILLHLLDVDKHINVGSRVKREIVKRHEKETEGVWY